MHKMKMGINFYYNKFMQHRNILYGSGGLGGLTRDIINSLVW